MKLYDVYPRFDINIQRAEGVYVYDEKGQKYLDLYGGHGVISIGHTQPDFVKAIGEQLNQIAFYSNSVQMPIQEQLAHKLGEISGYTDHNLFLCNSGAEANENALKVASFHTGRKKVIAFTSSFHGRTAATLNVTDNVNLSAPLNLENFPVEFIALNDIDTVQQQLSQGDVAAVIVEGIQGVGGLDAPTTEFLKALRSLCDTYETVLILDEIQSGFGRTGRFFAHQHADIQADIVSMAKGMGNGFPVGGVLISAQIKAKHGMLGTTFGGNHLACAATLAVLDVIERDQLIANATQGFTYLTEELKSIDAIKTMKGNGLMFGVELHHAVQDIRKQLLFDYTIFTGGAANPNVLRILPPLSITTQQLAPFVAALKELLV